MKGAVSELE